MTTTLQSLVLALSATYTLALADDHHQEHRPIQPSSESVVSNANSIFNALHSSGRQWGSSIYHNGFGFFPAIVPKGTLLYHGDMTPDAPPGPEWLAFEIEHAQNFAPSVRRRRGGAPPSAEHDSDQQQPLSHDDGKDGAYRGYLQTFRTNRDLNLLYIDGMAAGKSDMGMLDTQDLLLRENRTSNHGSMLGERQRAADICAIMTEWGYDGFVRMEIGFEVVQCDFTTGLDQVTSTRTFLPEDKAGKDDMLQFAWAGAVGERYDGLGGDRLRVDYSSMVSALFFPINISSFDARRPDLIRPGSATLDELKDIKAYLQSVVTQPRRFTVNWQAVADMIVTRFAKRLSSMGSSDLKQIHFIDHVELAILCWVDAPSRPDDITVNKKDRAKETEESIERCRRHYLLPVMMDRERWSEQDNFIYLAINTVVHDICHELLHIRQSLIEISPDVSTFGHRIEKAKGDDDLREVVDFSRIRVRRLMDRLGWTIWRKKQPCGENEVLFIAMWPYGDEADHWTPGCRSIEQMQNTRYSYWGD